MNYKPLVKYIVMALFGLGCVIVTRPEGDMFTQSPAQATVIAVIGAVMAVYGIVKSVFYLVK